LRSDRFRMARLPKKTFPLQLKLAESGTATFGHKGVNSCPLLTPRNKNRLLCRHLSRRLIDVLVKVDEMPNINMPASAYTPRRHPGSKLSAREGSPSGHLEGRGWLQHRFGDDSVVLECAHRPDACLL